MSAPEKPIIVNLITMNLDRPTVQLYSNEGSTFEMTLDALEQSIHNLMLARHMMQVHKDHEGCPDCAMNAIAKVGG